MTPAARPTLFRITAALVLTCGAVQPLRGQTPAETPADPAFEVASVKPNTSGEGRVRLGLQPGGRFVASNVTLRVLMRSAYQLQDQQLVGGPEWIGTARFDIVAKAEGDPSTPPPGSIAPFQLMLRTLLAERFNLAAHQETRQLPIYALAMARSDRRLGTRLRPSVTACEPAAATADGPPSCGITGGLARLSGVSVNMAQLAASLAQQVNRVVVNRTGLTGIYDFDLQWTPEQLPPRPPGAPADQPLRINGNDIDPDGPGLFTALREQLGLELDPQRGPVEVMVVDRIEPPTPD